MNRRDVIRAGLIPMMPALPAAAAETDAALQALEKKWAAAVLAKDSAALDAMYAEGLIYAHSTGIVETKAQYMTRLKSGAQHYTAIDYSSSVVKIYGDAGIVHSRVNMRGTSNGRPFDDKLMLLHVWVRLGTQWRLAAHQTAKLQ